MRPRIVTAPCDRCSGATCPERAPWPPGAALQGGAFDLEQAKRVAAGLENSYLFVQGPPGSGKTYTGAHLICHLLGRGARVGVASNSHAAIHNLLAEVERFAGDDPGWRGLKKPGTGADSRFRSERDEPLIGNSDIIGDFTSGEYRLVAGTAWLFAREELDGQLDLPVRRRGGSGLTRGRAGHRDKRQ